MKIKIIFLIVAMIRHSIRNDTATAIFEWPYHCEGGRILANISQTYFLLFYEYSKDQKKTDLKITSNNSETTRRKRKSETILLIFLVINIHGNGGCIIANPLYW